MGPAFAILSSVESSIFSINFMNKTCGIVIVGIDLKRLSTITFLLRIFITSELIGKSFLFASCLNSHNKGFGSRIVILFVSGEISNIL